MMNATRNPRRSMPRVYIRFLPDNVQISVELGDESL
jgi:hypothetical protein